MPSIDYDYYNPATGGSTGSIDEVEYLKQLGIERANQEATAALLANTKIVAPGQEGGLPSNIFQGPVSNLGIGGMGINALINLGLSLANSGQTKVGLDQIPASNINQWSGFSPTLTNAAAANMNVLTANPVDTYFNALGAGDVFPTSPVQTGAINSAGQVAFDSTAAAKAAADAAAARATASGQDALGQYLTDVNANAVNAAIANNLNQLNFAQTTSNATVMNPFVVSESMLPELSLQPTTGRGSSSVTGGADVSGATGGAASALNVANPNAPVVLPAFTTTGTMIDPGLTTAIPANNSLAMLKNFEGLNAAALGGVVTLPQFLVNASPFVGPTAAAPTTTPVSTETTGPVQLPAVTVTSTSIPTATTTATSATTGVNTGVVQMPTVTVTATSVPTATATTTSTGNVITLPPFVVPSTPLPTATVTSTSTSTISPVNPVLPVLPSQVVPAPQSTATTAITTLPTSTTATSSNIDFNVPGLGTLVPTATTPNVGSGRNFAAELAASTTALENERNRIMGMYGNIYQNLLGQTAIPQAAQSSLAQMQADQAKLQRIQSGQLAPDDIRMSQQAAREAYGARGQVMGPGAIGSEILNREAIRQQREDQARAGYQASMGNVLNAANLQTGNIFSPIGNLVSQTFNPLGAYPQDVYSSNFNAAQAQQIAAMNNAAAIEAAKYGAQAQRQAATTSGIFNIGTNVAKALFSCMPGEQTIDTPNGPVAVEVLKAGDQVIGYDGQVAIIMQHSSYTQDPTRAFIRFTLADGRSFVVCDVHKIRGIPAKEWAVGADMGGQIIKAMEVVKGINVSYDILTSAGGYQINGIAVNSMIPEMMRFFNELVKEVA